MAEKKDTKPHIYIGRNGKAEPFTSRGGGGGGSTIPVRNRQVHGAELRTQLDQVRAQQAELAEQAPGYELESILGIQVAFNSFPGVEMEVEKLADAGQHIELMNVRYTEDQVLATVFVPEGKLTAFENKLQAYLEERKDKNGKARDNRALMDAIQSFRGAALRELWTDTDDQWPASEDEVIWWEVWLPVRNDRQAVNADFIKLATSADMQLSSAVLEFPERSVLLAKGSRRQLGGSGLLLNTISELRRAKELASFFDGLAPQEQSEWVDELLERLERADSDGPYVCILDTGVNNGHPLLAPFVDDSDRFSVDPNWDVADDDGHGSGMAGLSVWGDLVEPLSGTQAVQVPHRLESVKLLRHDWDNEGKHYGIITADGVSLPEIANADRRRLFVMAVTSTDGRDRGRPSAWSSEVDSLASDYSGENANPRLIILAAGNVGGVIRSANEYPTQNELQDVHDPGQSWNSLGVGAYTEKDLLADDETKGGLTPLAPFGGISPHSTTSQTWGRDTPIKPEVVFEGGNLACDAVGCLQTQSLSLLSTHSDPVERSFQTFNATSAASALAARFAARVYAEYPNFWPETVRALMVHSAQWTGAMEQQFHDGSTLRRQAQHRVRCVGFGVPNLDKALWSVSNSLSMIVEDELQPFEKPKGEDTRTRDMHLHDLPWPVEALQELGEVDVEMTVTLSYFIEPNPSSRNMSSKYRYASHQLRFDVKRASESVDAFRARINRQAQDEESGGSSESTDPNWLFGPQFRHRGSVHKDVWRGAAADLAERGQIAVFPAMGWWRTRKRLERYDKKARYALIVSIAAPEVELDLYAEVVNQIEVETAVVSP